MSSTTTTAITPTVEETYHPGKTLQLYSYPPPIPPICEQCYYEDSPFLDKVADRYNKSIEERITIPSTPPDVSITLEERFLSSTHNISHVWLARVQTSSQDVYPSRLVAKIFDFAWFDDAAFFDPFKLRNLSVSREVETYRRLEQFQGTKVPRFYGHFITPLPSQQDRTVNVILMEYIPGRDLRHLVPSKVAGAVCGTHKDAVIEAVMELVLDMRTCGVKPLDFQPRNVILLPPTERREFCTSSVCPLRLEADPEDLEVVMIDFEMVRSVYPKFLEGEERRRRIARLKPHLLENWLEGYVV